jgi:hypothetical protein
VDDELELIAAPVFRLYAERHGYTHISAGDPALRMALVERVDTDYDTESFFVRLCYFTGKDKPYEQTEEGTQGPGRP